MLSRPFLARLLAMAIVIAPLAIHRVARADDSGSDDGGGGGDDSGDNGDGDDGDDSGAMDPDQPAVTAGGLFNKANYPTAEIDRPLTITGGFLELNVRPTISMNSGATFKIWATAIQARYGLSDTSELDAGFTGNLIKPAGFTVSPVLNVAFEQAMKYDLVDFRLGADIGLSSFAHPFDLSVGFPVKYRLKKNIAIIALERIFTVHTTSVSMTDAMGNTSSSTPKPDLNIGIGGIFQALPNLAIVARASLFVQAFEFNKAGVQIPVQAWVQFTPVRQFDLGLGLQLGNLKPAAGSPLDDRALLFVLRARI